MVLPLQTRMWYLRQDQSTRIVMQFNLYIFNQLFRTCMALITVLISIIWLFQSIRLLEFVVDKGASVGEFFLMSVSAMPLWLMITVPISGFIAVNWVFNRSLSDRELTAVSSRSDKLRLNTQLTAIKPEIGTVIINHNGIADTDIKKNSPTDAPLSTTNSNRRML